MSSAKFFKKAFIFTVIRGDYKYLSIDGLKLPTILQIR